MILLDVTAIETPVIFHHIKFDKCSFTFRPGRADSVIKAINASYKAKGKPTRIVDIPRNFPVFKSGMTTAQYVDSFINMNNLKNCPHEFNRANVAPIPNLL